MLITSAPDSQFTPRQSHLRSYHFLPGRNFPLMVITARSPFDLFCRLQIAYRVLRRKRIRAGLRLCRAKSNLSKREEAVDGFSLDLQKELQQKQKTEKCIAFFRFRFRISVVLTSSSFSSPLLSSRVFLLLSSLPPSLTSPPSNFLKVKKRPSSSRFYS